MRKIYITTLFIGLSAVCMSQKLVQPKQMDYDFKGIVYNTETAVQAKLYTNGMAVGLSKGRLVNYYKTRYYQFELGYLKDYREQRQNRNTTTSEGASNSFVFGKQNSFFMLKAGLGEKRYLSEKAKRRGLSVGFNYEAGVSLGILKPYYLELLYQTPEDAGTTIRKERYQEEINGDKFLSYDEIIGGSEFFRGLGKSKLMVGGHAKLGAHFAFGAFDKTVKAFEVGLMLDTYLAKVPILIEREEIRNNRIHLNLYMMFEFGKRK